MKLNDVYFLGKEILKKAGIENFDFDTRCIFEHCFGIKRQDLSLFRDNDALPEKEKNFFDCISKRKNHYPLQYILGYWYFMGRKFKIKEGVLIPRDDTEVLVNTAISLLKNKENIKILDLCSGSGIIAITLSRFFEKAKIIAVDISDDALNILKENITLNDASNIMIKKANVLDKSLSEHFENIDLIVSNPPYIKSCDLKGLQKEVQFEPSLALDGGIYGLDFYNSIVENFKKSLKKDAQICFEVGFNQADLVKEIFEVNGFSDIKFVKDINDIDRVVFATLK